MKPFSFGPSFVPGSTLARPPSKSVSKLAMAGALGSFTYFSLRTEAGSA
jgi:hypothetical protein